MVMVYVGSNLKIAIICEETTIQEWLSFASWYSIYKNLPKAQVELFCARSHSFFYWPDRVGVKIHRIRKR